MAKIYLAARYTRREELLGYRADLEALGHTVTSRWLNGSHQISDAGLSEEGTREQRERFALEDWEDLRAAEWTIAFTEEPRVSNSRGGRHIELGAALAWEKRVVIVGPLENIFCCLPWVEQYARWRDFMVAYGAVVFALARTIPTERDSQPHADDLARVAYEALVAYEGMAGQPLHTDAYEPWEALDATDQALMAHSAAAVEQAVLARLSAALDRQAARAVRRPGNVAAYGRLIDALVETAIDMGIERVGGVPVVDAGADDDDGGAGERGSRRHDH